MQIDDRTRGITYERHSGLWRDIRVNRAILLVIGARANRRRALRAKRVGLDALDAARFCNSNHEQMRDEGPNIRATPRFYQESVKLARVLPASSPADYVYISE